MVLSKQKVLYLDFELTQRQFTERYSAPSPIPGKLPVGCRFKFQRTGIKWDGKIPKAFKNCFNDFIQHSIKREIKESGARIVIIDNISYLAKNIMSNTACSSVMKTLKLWAGADGLSILVIAHARSRRRPAAITLGDIAGSSCIANLADSVFAIAHSTFGPEYRYVKHLKSRNAPLLSEEGWTPLLGGRGGGSRDGSDVLTYRIERMEIGKLKTENDPQNSRLSILNSQFPPTPFLGLTYLGEAAENDHLRDYVNEARLAQSREQNELRKLRTQSSRSALLTGLMDGTYTPIPQTLAKSSPPV